MNIEDMKPTDLWHLTAINERNKTKCYLTGYAMDYDSCMVMMGKQRPYKTTRFQLEQATNENYLLSPRGLLPFDGVIST